MGRILKSEEFRQLITKGEPLPFVVALGNEPFLLESVGAVVRNEAVDESIRDFNLDIFHGDDLTADALAGSVQALPMMADRRAVLVKAAESLSVSVQNYLVEYLKRPNTSTVLVLLVLGDAKLGLIKKLGTDITTIHCDTPTGRELEQWIEKYAASLDLKIDDSAVAMILDRGGANLIDLQSELEKANLLAGKKRILDLEILKLVWGIESDFDPWSFFDQLTAGPALPALRGIFRRFEDLEKDKEGFAGFAITQAARRLRLVHKEQTYDEKRTPYPQRTWSGKTQFQWRQASREVKTLPKSQAMRHLVRLESLDRNRKSTSSSVATQLCFDVCHHTLERKRAGR